CGLPAVASRIYGIIDAVEDGRTGLLHRAGDVDELTAALRRVTTQTDMRRSLGAAARRRAETLFPVERLTTALLSFYAEALAHTARPARNAGSRGGWYPRFGKRALDLFVAAAALVLLATLFAAIRVFVRATLGAPVLFRQRRPGRNGVPFTLVKFRSMSDRYDDRGRALPDAERLTRVGRLLRATSLDELPELLNVLRGDMSLVGPRP